MPKNLRTVCEQYFVIPGRYFPNKNKNSLSLYILVFIVRIKDLHKFVPTFYLCCDIVITKEFQCLNMGVPSLWGRPGFDRMSPDKKYSSLVNLNTKQKITGKNYSFVNARTSNAQLALA